MANAVHAGIAIVDALLVFHAGHRSASPDHGETIDLLLQLPLDRKELEQNSAHLAQLLGVKSASEYEERLLTAKDVAAATKHLDRLRQWARSKLP